jgi:hypothetical protein
MRRFWTDKEIEMLKLYYPDMPTSDLAKIFNRDINSLYDKAHELGIKKSEAFHNSELSGRLCKQTTKGAGFRFKKGHTSFNKGKKWDDYLSKEAQANSRKTSFKKNHEPHNTLVDGAIRKRCDKSGRNYKHIRTAKGVWVQLHVYNWQKAYGEIPKGYIVVFKTKSTDNCDVSNLELITRKENMLRNTIHQYPVELKQTIRTLSKLKKIIKNGTK